MPIDREWTRGQTDRVQYSGASTTGPNRLFNEDALGAFEPSSTFVIADADYAQTSHKFGFGPPLDIGRRAADLLVASLKRAQADNALTLGALDGLVAGAVAANRRIVDAAAADVLWAGVSVGLVALRLVGDRVHFAHIGLGRLYRARGGALRRMTLDHSLANERFFVEMPDPTTIASFVGVVIRAVGGGTNVDIDLGSWEAEPGDVYLLCSDGLTEVLSDTEIGAELATAASLEETCTRLLDLAEERDCENASVIVVRLVLPSRRSTG